MKKFLFALALGLLLVAAFATAASADNGPHGSFTATTDACAACHRVHSAQYGSNSLLIMDPSALCLSCHDGNGAGTNVVDGVYVQTGADAYYGGGTTEGTDGASLFGGGFDFALMATTWSGAVTANPAFNAASTATTSAHSHDGTFGTVWGSGANNSANASYALECTSCHDPHGTAGYTNAAGAAAPASAWMTGGCDPLQVATFACNVKTRSYRLLRWQPQGSSGFSAPAGVINWSGGAFPTNGSATGWTVPDRFAAIGTEWYTIGTTGAFAVGDYNAGNANSVYNLKNATAAEATTYIPAGINVAFFCAQCHDRYFNNSRLRNAGDYSAYCYGAATMPNTYSAATPFAAYNGVNNPTALTDVSGVNALYCAPAASTSSTTGYVWGDNRPSGDTTYMYRHASGDIRVSSDGATAAGTGTSISRSCVACHVAHGTSAAMTDFAGDSALTAGTPVLATDNTDNSVLLRMDNRSICLRCHAGTVNFVVAP